VHRRERRRLANAWTLLGRNTRTPSSPHLLRQGQHHRAVLRVWQEQLLGHRRLRQRLSGAEYAAGLAEVRDSYLKTSPLGAATSSAARSTRGSAAARSSTPRWPASTWRAGRHGRERRAMSHVGLILPLCTKFPSALRRRSLCSAHVSRARFIRRNSPCTALERRRRPPLLAEAAPSRLLAALGIDGRLWRRPRRHDGRGSPTPRSRPAAKVYGVIRTS